LIVDEWGSREAMGDVGRAKGSRDPIANRLGFDGLEGEKNGGVIAGAKASSEEKRN
jgi:hypothetical protein